MESRWERWWRQMDPADVRERITDVNDGIIAVAGTGLGLAGAEVGRATSYAVITIAAAAGTLSMFAVKLSESMTEREAHLSTAEYERRRLETTPEEEIAELVSWFESKGVCPETARVVAEEMSATDPVGAQLELEYGISRVASRRDTVVAALWAGLAFLTGAALPVLATLLVPFQWRTEWTLLAAGASLAVTSVILARRGHSNVALTVVRSLVIGLTTLGLSYAVGDLVL